jgi:ribosomal protein S18 acetylase RimI-like enzyme
MAAVERKVYIQGKPAPIGYIGDLKVLPDFRIGKIASSLIDASLKECWEMSGEEVPIYCTVLAGNSPVEKRAMGFDGLPAFKKVAALRVSSISFLWKKKPRAEGISIRDATSSDLDAMLKLWQEVAPTRQLAPYFTRESFKKWIENSPNLGYSAYRLALGPDGSLLGFVALWNQDCFKHMRVTRYSFQLKIVRFFMNLIAPLIGATPLPPEGGELRYLTAVNICVRPDRVDVLRALLYHCYNENRGKGYAFFSVGLDEKDPLNAALNGLMPQPMFVNVWMTDPKSGAAPQFDERPFHYEIALV